MPHAKLFGNDVPQRQRLIFCRIATARGRFHHHRLPRYCGRRRVRRARRNMFSTGITGKQNSHRQIVFRWKADANSSPMSYSPPSSASSLAINNDDNAFSCGTDKAQWLRTCNELRKIFQRIEPELDSNSSDDIEKDAQRDGENRKPAIDQRMFQSRLLREISYALGMDSRRE